MKLTAKSDLDVPINFVFGCLSDHATWEASAAERGIEIERPDGTPQWGPDAAWILRLYFRGRSIKMLMVLKESVPNDHLAYTFQANQLEGEFVLSIMALSPRRTRLNLALDVQPKTIAARLFLNTLRLTRGRVTAGLDARIRRIAGRIQDRYLTSPKV